MVQTETTMIRATSRCSIKIKDTFYTVEYCEEKQVHFDPDSDRSKWEEELAEVRNALWDTVNSECDSQIEDICRSAY